LRHLLVKREVMIHGESALIGEQLMIKLDLKGIKSCMKCSLSGSAYVFIKDSQQVVRISNHGKHRGWFRYNIRTDLKKSRTFYFSGERIFIFTSDKIDNVCFRIDQDGKNKKVKYGEPIVMKKPRKRR